jgi:hypothetical protein
VLLFEFVRRTASGAKTLEGGMTTLLQGLKAKEGDVEKLAAGAKSLSFLIPF